MLPFVRDCSLKFLLYILSLKFLLLHSVLFIHFIDPHACFIDSLAMRVPHIGKLPLHTPPASISVSHLPPLPSLLKFDSSFKQTKSPRQSLTPPTSSSVYAPGRCPAWSSLMVVTDDGCYSWPDLMLVLGTFKERIETSRDEFWLAHHSEMMDLHLSDVFSLTISQFIHHVDVEWVIWMLPDLKKLDLTYGVREIRMFGCKLSDATSIARAIEDSVALVTLVLSNSYVEDDSIQVLMSGLRKVFSYV
jgi:hypothetical protein